jgi:hypothetical protein
VIFTPPFLGMLKPESFHILCEDGSPIDTEAAAQLTQEAAP